MPISNAFPVEHLKEYQNWVDPDKDKAVALCTLNVALSESLYPALNIFEVTLRDLVNQSLVEYYGIDWTFQGLVEYHFENQRRKIDPKESNYKKYNLSAKAINKLLVSNMSLYYWTNILDPINFQIWEKDVKPIYNSEILVDKMEFFEKANTLRKLRNRIAHVKSIIQRNLRTEYDDCREILALLSKEALTWCDSRCRFWDVHPDGIIIKNDSLSPNVDLTPWM